MTHSISCRQSCCSFFSTFWLTKKIQIDDSYQLTLFYFLPNPSHAIPHHKSSSHSKHTHSRYSHRRSAAKDSVTAGGTCAPAAGPLFCFCKLFAPSFLCFFLPWVSGVMWFSSVCVDHAVHLGRKRAIVSPAPGCCSFPQLMSMHARKWKHLQ